jgi:hypothetical protein
MGVSPSFQGYFYKVVVQSVLLYGSELDSDPKNACGTLQVTPQHCKKDSTTTTGMFKDTTWYYPPIQDALEIAGLFTIEHYIRVRQNTVAAYVTTRPTLQIWKVTESSTTLYTAHSRQYRWWPQPLWATYSKQEDTDTQHTSIASSPAPAQEHHNDTESDSSTDTKPLPIISKHSQEAIYHYQYHTCNP